MPKSENVLVYRKAHPKNRCSYGIPGVTGIVVFDLNLFADGKAPKTLTVNCKEPKTAKEAKTVKVAKDGKVGKDA
jgi:hypothetical protein